MSDLNIIGSGGVQVGGLGIIYRWTTPTAFVGSGGVKVNGVGVIAHEMPGITAIIGSGGATVGGESVIEFITPGIKAVIGSGGVAVGGIGIITFTALPVLTIIGTGGVLVGGQGIIAFPIVSTPPILAIIGSSGVVVGGDGVISHALPTVLEVIGSGGIKVGGFRVPELTVVGFISPASLVKAVVGAGGVEAGGTGVITHTTPSIFAAPLPHDAADANVIVGGAGVVTFISPQILAVIGDGGVAVEPTQYTEDIFETWVLTGARGEPSIYANFPFNSYAKYRGQEFGAGPNGIYLLEGSEDAGEAIHPGIRIGPANFGTDREKRLRLVRCGGKTVGAKVRVSNGNGSAGYYLVEDGRAGISREVQGREITIDITDFDTLDHLEIVPLVLHKR